MPDETWKSNGRFLPQQPLVVIRRPQLERAKPSFIYYTLDGRAGKIILPSNGLILVRKLREGLVPADNVDENTGGRKYVSVICGPNQCWVPAGITVYAANHLARLQQRAKVFDRWVALFSKKKCLFSNQFLRTLTEFGLHNMRGSDEGMELIIAGVVKGLADEVGLPLTNLSLSYGCPSRHTLARGDKRLAADVLISVAKDIKNNNVKWIAFMVDHGKRSGIEHFVKIIIWAGRDSDGK